MASKGITSPKFGMEYSSSPAMKKMSIGMSETVLEVTVVSAEEVRLDSGLGRALCGRVYAVVHTASSAARTHVDDDRNCNGYPYWGEAVRVNLPERSAGIDVEIYRTRSDGRAESVAAARVPVADFSVGPLGHLHCLSYRLFDCGSRLARRNGIVNITVRRLSDAGSKTKSPAPPCQGKAAIDDATCGSRGGSGCAAAEEGKPSSALPCQGKAVVDDVTCGSSGGSRCAAAEEVRPLQSAAAPAGVVMGYPVGF